jgi:hypothetical protein
MVLAAPELHAAEFASTPSGRVAVDSRGIIAEQLAGLQGKLCRQEVLEPFENTCHRLTWRRLQTVGVCPCKDQNPQAEACPTSVEHECAVAG